MVRGTYSDASVAAFFEEKVVPLHVDIEQGEGVQIAKRFGVTGVPTMLVLHPNGEEIGRFGGYSPPEQLVASLKAVLAGESFSELKKKVAGNPADFRAAYRLALRYVDRGLVDEARPLFERVAGEENPARELRQAGAMNLAALESMVTGEPTPFEAFLEANPDTVFTVEIARYLLDFYMGKQTTEKVVKYAELAIAKGDPGKDAVFLGRYALYLAEHETKLERAHELVSKAATLAPDDPDVHDNAAEVYVLGKAYEKAVASRRKAVEVAEEARKPVYRKRLEKLLAELEARE